MDIKTKCEITNRESELLFFLSEGCTGKEIASHMDLSVRTVEYYMRRVRYKTNLQSRSQLISFFRNSIQE